MSGDVLVLARIRVDLWFTRPEAYREEVRAWMLANGIDPADVPVLEDVEVVLLDAPAVVRLELVRAPDGRARFERGDLVTRVVRSLCRVPLPEHLADPL